MTFLLVTGEGGKDEITGAIKLGVSGYVMKPFQGETLFKAIRAAKVREKTTVAGGTA